MSNGSTSARVLYRNALHGAAERERLSDLYAATYLQHRIEERELDRQLRTKDRFWWGTFAYFMLIGFPDGDHVVLRLILAAITLVLIALLVWRDRLDRRWVARRAQDTQRRFWGSEDQVVLRKQALNRARVARDIKRLISGR